MPVACRITSLAALAAMAALLGVVACSSDSALGSGGPVATSEIDQTIASDAGERIASDVSQFQENESFDDNMSSGSSTFMAGRIGADLDASSRTVTCRGPDAEGWFGCVAYTSRGLTITRQVRFWSGGSFALGWSPTQTDSVNHRWTRTGSFESILKPGKMISINEADTGSMIVTHGSPVLHAWTGARHRARQQHLRGQRRHAHLRLHGRGYGCGAHVHDASECESLSDVRLDLEESPAAHHGRQLRQDHHALCESDIRWLLDGRASSGRTDVQSRPGHGSGVGLPLADRLDLPRA
jgi:hypothetical protein